MGKNLTLKKCASKLKLQNPDKGQPFVDGM